MTIAELQIQLDLNPDNRVSVLKNADSCWQIDIGWKIDIGYLFIDQEDGQCYLFDKTGNLDDISKFIHIGYLIFHDSSSLTNIKIPDSVESIGGYAFENCTFLKNIKIPDSVKHISFGAFYNCTSLTSLKILNSVEIIGVWAFYNCTSLKEIVFKGKTIDQVKAMDNYPWAINNESVIKTES